MELDPARFPLTKKVGEVPEDEEKFLSWSGPYGYYQRPDAVTNPFKTDKMYSDTVDVEEMKFNKTLSSTLRDLNRSQVEFKPKRSTDARLLGTTSSMASFVPQRKINEIMKTAGTLENFKTSFEKICNEREIQGLPSSHAYVISLQYIPMIISDCLGREAPEFIVDKFVELSRKHSVAGRISWTQFSSLIPTVEAAVDAECKFRRELPALMVLMSKPRIEDKNLKFLGNLSSTYRDNFNSKKEISFADTYPGFVYTKNSDPTNIKGLNPAAQVLYAGTTKSTEHLPGFKGHIPMNVRNERKLEHSVGQVVHPVQNDLRLTQRGYGTVLGYTGHVPTETTGPRLERTTACDPRTSNGAAYGSTRTLL